MKVLKQKKIAWLIAIILVISSTLLSCHIKLDKKCSQITDGFYSGVNYDGYLHPSIFNQLKNISSYSLGIISIADNYGIDTANLNELRDHLESNLSESKNNISDLYDNYTALMPVLNKVTEELNGKTLSERDRTGYSEYKTNIDGAVSTIDSAGYNESVTSFMSNEYRVFPVNILGKLSGVHTPKYFA